MAHWADLDLDLAGHGNHSIVTDDEFLSKFAEILVVTMRLGLRLVGKRQAGSQELQGLGCVAQPLADLRRLQRGPLGQRIDL